VLCVDVDGISKASVVVNRRRARIFYRLRKGSLSSSYIAIVTDQPGEEATSQYRAVEHPLQM